MPSTAHSTRSPSSGFECASEARSPTAWITSSPGSTTAPGPSSAPGTFETLAWTKMAFWTPSAPHQAPTRIAPCRGLGRGIRVVMSLLRDFVADAAFVCCRLVDSSVRPGFNIQCNHGNKARWGFCNNCKSQPCQNSDSHDADAAIGIGLDGQATSEMGAGWTKCHS